MKASQIIAESFLCRQAARNIYPQDPEELFNTVWLKFAEKEIQDPNFNPANPKHYFYTALKNQVIDWQRKEIHQLNINEVSETEILTFEDSGIPDKDFLNEWLNAPTDDEDLLFLKNILTLALNCRRNNEVINMIGISHRQYYEYKKLAKERLYADYHATNIGDLSSLDLV